MSTYAAAEVERISHRRETEEEQDVPLATRLEVLERDGHKCVFPGCSMRAHLGLHHIRFRSQGGGHDPENLLVLCDAHHGLIHDRICSVEGKALDDLEFKGPFLSEFPRMMKEARQRASGVAAENEDNRKAKEDADSQTDEESTSPTNEDEPPDGPGGVPNGEADEEDDESSEDWRDETVAAIFDGPPSVKPEIADWDPIGEWARNYKRRKRKERLMKGRGAVRAGGNGRDHVIAGGGNGKSKRDHVIVGRETRHRGLRGSSSAALADTPPP